LISNNSVELSQDSRIESRLWPSA